jgi:hypothetical protein
METAIAARQKGSAISQCSRTSSEREIIATNLTYMAISRRGQLDQVDLKLYCDRLQSLPVPIEEICAALKDIAETPRGEGETAIPDVGTILDAVREAGRFRVVVEARRKREQEDRHLAEHPEAYVAVRDIFAEVIEKKKGQFSALAAKNAEPARCPHCEGVLPTSATLSKMSAADHRSVADAMDRRAQQGVGA